MRYEVVVIDADRFAPADYRTAPRVRQGVRDVTSTRTAAEARMEAWRARADPLRPGPYVSTVVVREVDVALVHVEAEYVHVAPEPLDTASWLWAPWAYWADDTVTSARFIEERPRTMGAAAAGLVSLMRGSGSSDPACGWALLARVAEVRAREEVASSRGRGRYVRDTVERLRVVMVDGEERDLWMRQGEHARGFDCDIRGELPDDWRLNHRGVLEPWRH
ncbi:MAG: hypothetical protein JWM10_3785 [Myxococcaceae bacterium]|nr:hypothetical protein [Myxococcaceae bacterium]